MVPVLTSHLQFISCNINQTLNANRKPPTHQNALIYLKNNQQTHFSVDIICPAADWREVEFKQLGNSRLDAPHGKAVQDSKLLLQLRGNSKRSCLCILRLQSDCKLNIQTNLLEKLKGWHSQCWMVVTTFMDRDALDSILVYVQVQIKVEGEEFSSPLSHKNKS